LENTGYFDLKREEKEVSSLFLTSLKGYPLLGPFLCPSPLCLWGRFGVPYKGSAGHRGWVFLAARLGL
jgi:hypothetical protein